MVCNRINVLNLRCMRVSIGKAGIEHDIKYISLNFINLKNNKI